jgi:hypothetical protein
MSTLDERVDSIWRLARQPFTLTRAPRLPHACKWEVFASGRAGCMLCGAIHVCDALTCRNQISMDDSVLCAVTGAFLSRVYGVETWSDRSICSSLERKSKNELNYDVETHLHDLLLSANARAYSAFEQSNYLTRATAFLEPRPSEPRPSGGRVRECVVDVLADIVQSLPWRVPVEFCAAERERVVKACAAAIAPSAATLFRNRHFKICRANQKAIVFGLVYLLRSGVMNEAQVVLPRMAELSGLLPLEIHLKAFFGVSPSSITDTENRLKFVIRSDRV